jgi:NAD+ diphosphatase
VTYNFAFVPGQLDRAAALRSTETTQGDQRARIYVFWRGKLLVDRDNAAVLVPFGHPALSDCRDKPLFLGMTTDGPRFAADLALWAPREDAATIGQFIDASQQVHPAFPEALLVEIRGIMASLSPLDGECVAVARALSGWHASHGFCAKCGLPSEMVLGGWERVCPACGTHHFPRTDPVVIMVITRGDRLLLGRGASWPERMYSLLAGFVEPGETIEAAVRRETFEEAGIRVGGVHYVASQPWPFPMSLMFGCRGEALDETITLDLAELTDARWVTRDEVRDMLAGTHPDMGAPRHGAIAAALIAAWADGKLDENASWSH